MIKYPDYDKSILSIASSVLNFFGANDCTHQTLSELDELLSKNYKNVIVMLFDGMGSSILKEHLAENDFLRRHDVLQMVGVISIIKKRCSYAIHTQTTRKIQSSAVL